MIIVITGTHKGIGLELAKYYIDSDNIVIGCSRHESVISNENYYHYIFNLCNPEQISSFAAEVQKNFGYIDVLINNAGIASMNHFLMTPIETAQKIMETNYLSAYSCIRVFISLLRKSVSPRIVNFSSIAVPLNLDGELSYVASKSAIESMTKILAKELAMFKITVNAIAPSPIKTDLIAKVSEKKLANLLEKQAIHRFGTFKDVFNVIDFFIKPESDFITGQILYLGGVFR